MIYFVLGVLANAIIFLTFRTFPHYKIDNLQAIVVNYVVCVITGIIYTGSTDVFLAVDYFSPLGVILISMGFLFIAGFYTASLTSQFIGVSVTSVASKMSMVVPILFSLLFLKIDAKDFSLWNYIGMFLAVFSIILASIRKENLIHTSIKKRYRILLPSAVFICGGAIDTIINFSNHTYLTSENREVFPIILFAFAAGIGVMIMLFKKKRLALKNVIGGVFLGIPNFFGLLFILKALSIFQNNGAVFFPIYNVGIILVSTIGAMIIFREKLSGINYTGLVLSMLALYLLSYQEIIGYFSN